MLLKFISWLDTALRQSGLTPGKSGRHMKFPYTFSAKVAQFPWIFYMRNNNIWMYYPVGILVASPIFMKLTRMAMSEENKKSWAESQRKSAERAHH